MRKFLGLLLFVGWVSSGVAASAGDDLALGAPCIGVPIQNAILTRRYGPVVTESEVAGAELEAGYGATNLFQFVQWRRQYSRPWWGSYGWFGPRYYVGFGPRFYGLYPPLYRGPAWGYFGSFYGGLNPGFGGYGFGYGGGYGYGYGGGYFGSPYVSGYAPPSMPFGRPGGYGGCFYW